MNCIDVSTYGIVPNDPTFDNSVPITHALSVAATNGNKACMPPGVYYFLTTIEIPAGVILTGVGTGNDPLNTSPVMGTVLAYQGNQVAIELAGHNSGLRDLTIDNKSNVGSPAKGGINILADNDLVESVGIDNVQIYSFMNDAFGVQLEAINGGGIAYNSFYRVRVRHASTAFCIKEEVGSFINSNRFYDFVFSGAPCSYGLRILGGNNNVFYGAVLEAESSTHGHIVVEKGKITARDIRIEANQQDAENPVIHFHSQTYENIIEGFSEGKGYIDEGDNFINTRSNSNSFTNPGINLFRNSPFKGVINSVVPDWEIVNNPGVTISQLPSEILENHAVLEFQIPAGIVCQFRPLLKYNPQTFESEKYNHANFGFYVKGDYDPEDTDVILTHQTQNPTTALTSSFPYSGNNQWHYLGMTAITNGAQNVYPQLFVNNTNNASTLTLKVTTPSYVFGIQSLSGLSSPNITSAGGQITGMLSMGFSKLNGTNYISGTTYLVIPKNGNYFDISGTQNISRINHQGGDQLPVGTVITLIFESTNLTVQHGAYIALLNGNYVSSSGSSLTLISNAPGTWKEITRNL